MLFDSLQMAGTSLNATSLGIQVTGQNMANVNTPGYVREQVILETAGSRQTAHNVIGNGVRVAGVTQIIDEYLEERLRGSISDAMSSTTRENCYTKLEALLKELTTDDLSTSLMAFFDAIDEIDNSPESTSMRQMAATEGAALAKKLNDTAEGIRSMREDINKDVVSAATQINLLTKQIQELNMKIVQLEAGRSPGTEAVGLRDERLNALTQLSQLINIKVVEDKNSGAVTINCGSDILLEGTLRNEVTVDYRTPEGENISLAMLTVGKFKSVLDVRSGVVAGLYKGRDDILSGYAAQLDDFAYKLVEGFNGIYTSGQGLSGYTDLTGGVSVEDPDVPLNMAGLDYTPVNGGFNILVLDTKTGTSTPQAIKVEINDPLPIDPFSLKPVPNPKGTTLNGLIEQINGIDGLSAKLTPYGELRITADSPDIQFSFSEDTSGVLAALGVNTFFTGSSASTIGVNATVLDDPGKFAASREGIGKDTLNAVALSGLSEQPLKVFGDATAAEYYRAINDKLSVAGGTTRAIASADQSYYSSLQTQRDAVSGVNLDDETLNLLIYQRSYQATSKYITAINEMLTYLLQI